MKTHNELKQKLIDDLKSSGFPLEVLVSNLIEDSGWRVESSPLYVDYESGTPRELDVYGLRIYKHQNLPNLNDPSLFSHLIIQCKKKNKPWIFFDNARDIYYWIGFYGIKCDDTNIITRFCDEKDSLHLSKHRYKITKIHKSFHIYNGSTQGQTGNQDIYESLMTVCKALNYYKKMYSSHKTLHIFTPIVVLDGTLWSATLGKKSKILIKEVSNLIVRFDYIFGDKRPRNLNYQLVEVITAKEFKKRIKLIQEDNAAILEGWIKFLEK